MVKGASPPGGRGLGKRLGPTPAHRERYDVTLLLTEDAVSGEDAPSPPPSVVTRRAEKLGLPTAPRSRPGNPRAVLAIKAFALKHGLTVVRADPKHRIAILEGTEAQLEAAFGIELGEHEHGHGTVVAHDGEVSIPEELAGLVGHILPDRRPLGHHRLGGALDAAKLEPVLADEGTAVGPISAMFTAAELREVYGFPPNERGAGQCIGIIALGGGYYEDDLEEYFAAHGLPRPEVVAVGENRPGDRELTRAVMEWMNTRGAVLGSYPPEKLEAAIDTVETTMDIQAAGSFAPEARIVVYIAPGGSYQDLIEALAAVVDDEVNRPSVVSISHGLVENQLNWIQLSGINWQLQQLAEAHITVCCASGDFGAQGVATYYEPRDPHVVWPAASPWALACGGTRIILPPGPRATAIQESEPVVFREKLGAPIGQMASGGGFSTFAEVPPWQGATLEAWAKITRTKVPAGRGIPDVALVSHMETSFPIRVAGYDATAGGTSAAAPVMAALVACMNEVLGIRLGHLTPMLYDGRVSPTFESVTMGDNDITGDVRGFHAQEGWDPCTGFGCPTADVLPALWSLLAAAGELGEGEDEGER